MSMYRYGMTPEEAHDNYIEEQAYKRGYEKAKEDFARPHGAWKVDNKIYCSECGKSICDFIPNPNDAVALILDNKFCFNCGALMILSKSEIEKAKSEIVPDYRDGWRKRGEAK